MKAKTVFTILTTIILHGTSIANAGDSLSLTVPELFRLADQNSRKLRLDAIGVEAAEAYTHVAKDRRLPDVSISVAAGYLADVAVIGLGNMKSGLYPMPHLTNSYVLEASYLVFNGGKVNRDIGMSDLRSQIARLNFEKDKDEVKLLLVSYYLDMYRLYRQRMVYEKNIEQALAVLGKIRNRLIAGIVLKSDLLRSELLLEDMKLQLLKVNNRILILNYNMVEMLNLPEATRIFPSADLPHMGDSSQALNTWLTQASQNDPALKISTLNVQLSQKNQQQVKADYLPKASLYADNGLVRPFIYDIPAKDIYANRLNVGFRLSYDIGALYKNKTKMIVAQKQIETEKQQLDILQENSRKAVFSAYTLFTEAGEQFAAEQKKLELANENYRRISNNYQQQLALITDMTDASNQKLDAELQMTTAQTQILMRYYELLKTTGKIN